MPELGEKEPGFGEKTRDPSEKNIFSLTGNSLLLLENKKTCSTQRFMSELDAWPSGGRL
jgi:hypothetical protein